MGPICTVMLALSATVPVAMPARIDFAPLGSFIARFRGNNVALHRKLCRSCSMRQGATSSKLPSFRHNVAGVSRLLIWFASLTAPKKRDRGDNVRGWFGPGPAGAAEGMRERL